MINIFNDLEELNKPIYAQGDAPLNLPNEFYTISEDATSDTLYGNNKAVERLYEYTLIFYTKEINNATTGLIQAINVLQRKGYIISGIGAPGATYNNSWACRVVDVMKIEYL